MRRFVSAAKDRVNWVDENNVLLGFELGACCCEDFGYYYVSDPNDYKRVLDEAEETRCNQDETEPAAGEEPDLEDYVFDTGFFGQHLKSNYYDEENFVIFKMSVPWKKDKQRKRPAVYLVLFNMHNGYYSHGFNFARQKENAVPHTFQEGDL